MRATRGQQQALEWGPEQGWISQYELGAFEGQVSGTQCWQERPQCICVIVPANLGRKMWVAFAVYSNLLLGMHIGIPPLLLLVCVEQGVFYLCLSQLFRTWECELAVGVETVVGHHSCSASFPNCKDFALLRPSVLVSVPCPGEWLSLHCGWELKPEGFTWLGRDRALLWIHLSI